MTGSIGLRLALAALLALAAATLAAGEARAVTVTAQVDEAYDDAYCTATYIEPLVTSLYWPYGESDRLAVARWPVQVPPDATITSAYIRLKGMNASSQPSVARIKMFDTDNCRNFQVNPFAWPVGATTVDWSNSSWLAGQWNQSCDIKSLVQAFIARPGYQPGFYIGLAASRVSGSGKGAYQYDYGDHTSGAILEINYTGGSAVVDLWMADPEVRLGQKIYCQLLNVNPTDRLRARLDGTVIYERAAPLQAEEIVPANYTGLAAGSHTLLVEIVDQGGAVRGSGHRTWTKLHNGVGQWAIDENNAICRNGVPFFPITPWGLEISELPTGSVAWKDRVNALCGQGWNVTRTAQGFLGYLNGAAPYGLPVIGPAMGNYWPGGRTGNIYEDPVGSGNWVHLQQLDINAVANYINAVKNNPSLMMYCWHDEPDLGGGTEFIPPVEVRRWTDKCHELDTQRLHYINIVGYSFTGAPPWPSWTNARAQSYCFLYNDQLNSTMGNFPAFTRKTVVADVLSFDYYPYEYITKNPTWMSLDDYALALDRFRDWNYNLVPIMTWVETCDIDNAPSYTWTPPPTPAQLKNLIWLSIVHGAKGISWFHYFQATPAANQVVMATAKTQIAALAPAILGPEVIQSQVGCQVLTGGRVDFLAREHNNQLYIFAASTRTTTDTARFTVAAAGLEPTQTVTVYGEGRTLTATGGVFDDSFAPVGVHIYVLDLAVPRDVTQWQAAATHGGATVNESLPAGGVYAGLAGLRQLRLTFSGAVDPATVAPAAFGLSGQAGAEMSNLIATATLEPGGAAIVLNLSAALPDADRYTVLVRSTLRDTRGLAFAGATTRVFGCLAGDADGSGQVSRADLLELRRHLGQPVTSATARYDLDGSGTISNLDVRAIRLNLGHSLP